MALLYTVQRTLTDFDKHRQREHLLGIPDTNFSGLNTLTARNVRRSNSDPTEDRILEEKQNERRQFYYVPLKPFIQQQI